MGKKQREDDYEDNNQVFTLDDILGVQAEEQSDENNEKEKEEKKVKLIPNPLPVPKRREHVAMDYAIDVPDDDDFDLQDMTGMDFFDYE